MARSDRRGPGLVLRSFSARGHGQCFAAFLCRSRWREERQVCRRGRAGRCPGAAGPGCSAPGTRPGRRADAARRGSASGRGVLGAGWPARRSQIAFIRGAWTAVRTILAPVAWNTASKAQVKFDPRSRIRKLMSANLSSRPRARLRACCTVHSPVGFAVMPPRCSRRVPCSMNTRTYHLLRSTVSACRKSTARIPAAWACRNCRQVGPERRGAGSMPAACRICQTVDGATVTPSLVSSPWMRRCPHRGFSFARRTTRRVMPGPVGGRPGVRRLLVSYLPATSLRCQASSVAGVTGKMAAQRLPNRSAWNCGDSRAVVS